MGGIVVQTLERSSAKWQRRPHGTHAYVHFHITLIKYHFHTALGGALCDIGGIFVVVPFPIAHS